MSPDVERLTRLTRGDPGCLGARLVPGGVNVAVLAPDAEFVELCLFAPEPDTADAPSPVLREVARGPLPGRDGGVHHGLLPGAGAGLLYGLRAHGPWEPRRGLRFHPGRLLVDPWALGIRGEVRWDDAVHAHDRRGMPERRGPGDSAPFVPKGLVVDPTFAWGDDARPRVPLRDTVVYEAHVRWLTARHPDVPEALRGTYGALGHPAVIEHLQALSVTTLELMPVHAAATEERLARLGLTNAWGYGALALLAPDPRFAAEPDRALAELQGAVRALHAAGIEVILDVVVNHTVEGGAGGPSLSLRGLGEATYYRLDAEGRHVDHTGCGNTLDTGRAPGRRLALDALRSFAEHAHVDGFRLDLAPALFRDGPAAEFAPDGPFARAIAEDPTLAGLKWIAEPWDLGPRGYRLGEHPPGFLEWNDRFRDTARRFWRGDVGQVPPMATALAGSSDVFARKGPLASVQFVACHDGFTLGDLVSYARKHNAENGEDGRDGTDANWSAGWGAEGPTGDARILATRGRVQRSLLATVAVAAGVPMIGQGDEVGRSQGGNNNAYCQDRPALWVPWGEDADAELHGFARHAFALRRRNGVLRRATFFPGDERAIRWRAPDGTPLVGTRWAAPPAGGRTLVAWLLAGAAEVEPARDVVLVLHAGGAPLPVRLPEGSWRLRLDASRPALRDETVPPTPGGATVLAPARALLLFEADGPAPVSAPVV